MDTEYMSAVSSIRTPFRYAFRSVILTLIAGAVIAAMSAPVLFEVLYSGERLFGFLGVISIAALAGQQMLQGDVEETRPSSTLAEIGQFLFAFAYYNMVVFLTALAGVVAMGASGSMTIATAVALLYPFYEHGTARRAIPLSLSGLLVWSIALGILLHRAGKHVLTLVEEYTWEEIASEGQKVVGRTENFAINYPRSRRLS